MKEFVVIICSFLLCVMLMSFVLGSIMHMAPVGITGIASVGTPYYFHDDSMRWGEITDYAVCQDILYVLYGGKEILDCYSLDGTYLHSYSIELGEKGKAALYTSNGILHLKTKGLTFYTFETGFFVDTYDVSATELYPKLEELTGEHQSNGENKYELHGASIWRNVDGIREEIVRRPAWMAVFQGNTLLLLGPVCFIALCTILYYYKKQA